MQQKIMEEEQKERNVMGSKKESKGKQKNIMDSNGREWKGTMQEEKNQKRVT